MKVKSPKTKKKDKGPVALSKLTVLSGVYEVHTSSQNM